MKSNLVDSVDVKLFGKLNNYVFQGRPLSRILSQYKAQTNTADDSDGKGLYGYLISELRSIRKDRDDLVELVVKYLIETNCDLVNALTQYLTQKIAES